MDNRTPYNKTNVNYGTLPYREQEIEESLNKIKNLLKEKKFNEVAKIIHNIQFFDKEKQVGIITKIINIIHELKTDIERTIALLFTAIATQYLSEDVGYLAIIEIMINRNYKLSKEQEEEIIFVVNNITAKPKFKIIDVLINNMKHLLKEEHRTTELVFAIINYIYCLSGDEQISAISALAHNVQYLNREEQVQAIAKIVDIVDNLSTDEQKTEAIISTAIAIQYLPEDIRCPAIVEITINRNYELSKEQKDQIMFVAEMLLKQEGNNLTIEIINEFPKLYKISEIAFGIARSFQYIPEPDQVKTLSKISKNMQNLKKEEKIKTMSIINDQIQYLPKIQQSRIQTSIAFYSIRMGQNTESQGIMSR